MSGQIIFFEKNKADFQYTWVMASASQGNAFASKVLNRSNNSAWITTDSVDADNTTLTIDIGDSKFITDIILIKHNFKSFQVKYWNGSSYVNFSPAINETTNTKSSNYFPVAQVSTMRIQLTVFGTQTPNEDKYLYQFIMTAKLGQLTGWPMIKKPTHSRNKKKSQMLSGKYNIQENVGFFACALEVESWSIDADLAVVESLYNAQDGFLLWLCGGNEDQFKTKRQGYRLEDLYLMKCLDDYQPEYRGGIYSNGLKIGIDMAEVID